MAGRTTTRGKQQNRRQLQLPKYRLTLLVWRLIQVSIASQFWETFQQYIVDLYYECLLQERAYIYIHEKHSLLRIEIDQNLVDDIEADDVKSSINCRFSPRDVQQNIQEERLLLKMF